MITQSEAIDLLNNHDNNLVSLVASELNRNGFDDVAVVVLQEAQRLNFLTIDCRQQVDFINRAMFRHFARIPNTLDLRNLLAEASAPIDWVLDFFEFILPKMKEILQ